MWLLIFTFWNLVLQSFTTQHFQLFRKMWLNSLKLSWRRCVGPVDWWLCRPLNNELIKPGDKQMTCQKFNKQTKIQNFPCFHVKHVIPLARNSYKSKHFFFIWCHCLSLSLNYRPCTSALKLPLLQKLKFSIRCYFLVHTRLCEVPSVMWLSEDQLL